jgi:hypothetical protein
MRVAPCDSTEARKPLLLFFSGDFLFEVVKIGLIDIIYLILGGLLPSFSPPI